MKYIYRKKFLDYFKIDDQYRVFSNFFYRNYYVFNKVTFLVVIFIFTTIMGIFWNHFLAISLSLAIGCLASYYRITLVAKGLRLERTFPIKAQEDDLVIIQYNLYNNSSFSIRNFIVTDVYEGSSDRLEKRMVSDLFQSHSLLTVQYKRKCDAGMGVKRVGPLTVLLSDSLGIFEFEVVFDSKETVVVYPRIEKLPSFPVRGTVSSIQIGIYDMYIKGNSTNFYGIRDYVKGDPLNHIHWKLSLRNRRLIVKEFEKNVNAYVSIVANMDSRLQMGKGAESTWEYMKDISLAIASQQLEIGNEIQFLANHDYIPFGRGEEFVRFLEIRMTSLEPKVDEKGDSFVRSCVDKIPYASTIFYLCPYVPSKLFSQNLDIIKKLAAFGGQVFCIFIDGFSYMLKTVQNEHREKFIEYEKMSRERVKVLTKELNKSGIVSHIVPIELERKKYYEYF